MAGAVVVAAGAVAWATVPGGHASGPGFSTSLAGADGPTAPAGLRSGPTAASLPADTPPPLRDAGAWPFEDLPLVIKAPPFPSPRIAVPFNAPSPADDLFVEALVGPIPSAAVAPAGVGAVGQAPWLLLPPVAGLAIFALDDTGARDGGGSGRDGGGTAGGGGPQTPPGGDGGDGGGGEPVPPAVVPEPATWALLLTGLLIVGAHALRRRGRRHQPRSG